MSAESETGGEALSLDEGTLLEAGSWEEPVRRSYYYLGGQRVAMRQIAGEPEGQYRQVVPRPDRRK